MAARAGSSEATIYRRWTGKQDILVAAVARSLRHRARSSTPGGPGGRAALAGAATGTTELPLP